MWCLSFALALALFDRRLHWFLRGLLLLYAAGFVYWGFIMRITWLSGWVPTFAAAAGIVFLRSKKLFAILTIIAIIGAGGYYWRTSFEAETQESGVTRLAAYEVNWRVTGKHWLFGTGPAGYASYYMSYFPTEAMASHNNYIDTLAQTGIVGSLFFLWFFGAQAWGGYKLRRKLQDRGDFAESLSAAVVGGTIGCVVAMALGDWLLPFAYTQGIIGFDLAMFNWLFMGSLWALKHSLAAEASTTDELSVPRE
jgi:O-antigen ligase